MNQETEQNTIKDNTEIVKEKDPEKELAEQIYDDGKGDDKSGDEKKGDEQTKSEEKKTEDEEKPDEDKKSEEESKKAEDEKKPEDLKPEDFELKLPEGQDWKPENKQAVIELATEQKWTEEQAQTNVDAFYKMRQTEIEANLQEAQDRIDGWKEEISNDPKIGGKKLEENLALADGLIAKVGEKAFYEEDFTDENGKEFKAGDPIKNEKGIHQTKFGIMLQQSGMGSHPDFVRFMVDLGHLVTEDQIVIASAAQTQKSDGEVFYPNQGKT